MKKILAVISVLLCAALLFGCTPAAQSAPDGARTVTDYTGRVVSLPADVERIAALGPSALRLLCYAGQAGRVIGVEQFEKELTVTKPYTYVHPELAELPVIGQGGGGGGSAFTEELVRLKPDVIFAAYDRQAADTLQTQTGIPVIAVSSYGVFAEETDFSLSLIGEVLDCTERTDALISYTAACREDLAARTADIPEAERPTVYAGGVGFNGPHGFDGTHAHYPPFDAIGARNVVDETGETGAFLIELEKVLAWQPDVLFLNPENLYLVNEDYARNPDFYNSLTAVQQGEIYAQLPYNYYSTNIELALADAYYAGCVLYPEQFADIDIAEKADEIFETFLGVPFYEELAASGYRFEKLVIGADAQ